MDEQSIAKIAAMAVATAAPIVGDEASFVMVPDGYSLQTLPDTEDMARHPRRKQGTVRLRDVTSFILYVQRHAGEETLILQDGRSFTAYLNHHEPGRADASEAGWADHKAWFEPRWTPGWTAWTGYAGKWLGQDDLANFLEERIGEIAEPDGATVLEAVRKFQLAYDVAYERISYPSNDFVQLIYRETEGAGEIRVPRHLDLVLTPFDGATAAAVRASLRFAKPDAQHQVKFQFVLGEEAYHQIEKAMREAAGLIQAATGLAVLAGTLG